jgi:uncharacterized membrane protein YedE/YeeE
LHSNGLGTSGTVAPLWDKAEKIRTAIAGLLILLLLGLAYLLSSGEQANTAPISLLMGTALGILFERGRFCFFCIFREGIEEKNSTPFISVLVAIATGAIGYSIVFGQFLPDTSSDSLPPGAHISPVSWPLALAAFAFGIGMTLSGACISGHLYRLGQGYLRAIPALIGSFFGIALGFLSWNWFYLNAISDARTIWLPHYIGYSGSLALTLLVLLAIGLIALKKGTNSEAFRTAPSNDFSLTSTLKRLTTERWSPIATGAIVGIIGVIAYLRIEPLGVTRQISTTTRTTMENRGIGPEVINGIDRMAGCIAVVSDAITNNGWLILGIVVASFAAALSGNRFKLSKLTPRNTFTALLGGILLGWGSMISLGCTIGVLLSGTQAFAISGWVFFAFAFLGVWVGLRLRLHKS